VINTHMALATTQKGSSTASEYLSKMKMLTNEMASAGKKLDDEELCSYILAGLDFEYNLLVSSIAAWVELITVGELYSQLLFFETTLELQSGGQVQNNHQMTSLANNASRGHDSFSRGRGGHNSRGGTIGGRGQGDQFTKTKNRFPPCQLCGRTNHLVFKCYKRFDPSYMGEEKSTYAAHSHGVDSSWYGDSGATDHVTGEHEKLVVRDKYNGTDQIYIASESGMHIKHIGHSIIHTPSRDLSLNTKNLASVHRIASDNNVFFELHPDFFLIKDRESRRTLLGGSSKGGLYPIPCSTSTSSSSKQVFSVSKVPMTRWHAHLGHPSSAIVRFVLNKNSLPFSSNSSPESVCDACQQAKCHQLPYPISTSASKAPLELIFSDV
jgi:hypothetical protein